MLRAMHPSPPRPSPEQPGPLVLYSRPGCHLCEEALATLGALLHERAAAGWTTPAVVERDITTDPAWEREFLVTIPVIELDGRRLELATSHARIRAFLGDVLDGAASVGYPSKDVAGRTGEQR
jgi:hypothetical protein